MKLTLRSLPLLFLLLWQLPLLAATFTIKAGSNFCQPTRVGTQPSGVVMGKFVSRNNQSATSIDGAWTAFLRHAASATKTTGFFTTGRFPYSYAAYGTPGLSQLGVVTPGATLQNSTARVAPTFSLSPNPAHGLVTVSMTQFGGNDYKLRLSNIIGREVRTVAVRPEAAEGGMTLNLADLPSGMYFYSLLQNDKVVSTKRLVLQN